MYHTIYGMKHVTLYIPPARDLCVHCIFSIDLKTFEVVMIWSLSTTLEAQVTIEDQKKWDGKGPPPGAVDKSGNPPTISTARLTDLQTDWLCYVLFICVCTVLVVWKSNLMANGFPRKTKSSIPYHNWLLCASQPIYPSASYTTHKHTTHMHTHMCTHTHTHTCTHTHTHTKEVPQDSRSPMLDCKTTPLTTHPVLSSGLWEHEIKYSINVGHLHCSPAMEKVKTQI